MKQDRHFSSLLGTTQNLSNTQKTAAMLLKPGAVNFLKEYSPDQRDNPRVTTTITHDIADVSSSDNFDFVLGLNIFVATGEGGFHKEVTEASSHEISIEIEEWISRTASISSEMCTKYLAEDAEDLVKEMTGRHITQKTCNDFFDQFGTHICLEERIGASHYFSYQKDSHSLTKRVSGSGGGGVHTVQGGGSFTLTIGGVDINVGSTSQSLKKWRGRVEEGQVKGEEIVASSFEPIVSIFKGLRCFPEFAGYWAEYMDEGKKIGYVTDLKTHYLAIGDKYRLVLVPCSNPLGDVRTFRKEEQVLGTFRLRSLVDKRYVTCKEGKPKKVKCRSTTLYQSQLFYNASLRLVGFRTPGRPLYLRKKTLWNELGVTSKPFKALQLDPIFHAE